jgi:hypothetical protein
MGTGRNTEARQLIGGDAPVRGDNQLVLYVLVRCAHATKSTAPPHFAPNPPKPGRETLAAYGHYLHERVDLH